MGEATRAGAQDGLAQLRATMARINTVRANNAVPQRRVDTDDEACMAEACAELAQLHAVRSGDTEEPDETSPGTEGPDWPVSAEPGAGIPSQAS